jgi:CheY-like chemotaxis protein
MTGKPLILCADDSPGVLEGWKAILKREGYEVLTATNGKEALQVFVSHPVDLVLLDYRMPEMNGDLAARHMKACKPDVPVALLSADDWMPPGMLETVDAFVSKSERIPRLLEIVDHLVSLRFLFQPLSDVEKAHGGEAAITGSRVDSRYRNRSGGVQPPSGSGY